MRVDNAAGAEYDTVRIDQKHPAVGSQSAINPTFQTGVLGLNPVQHSTDSVLLLEVSGFPGPDRETLPIDDRTGAVDDRQFVALLLQDGLAVHHLCAGRIGMGQLGSHPVDACQRDDECAKAKTGGDNHLILLT